VSSEHRREPTFDASWPCGLHGASLRRRILHQPRDARIKQKGALEGAPSVKLGGGSGFAAGKAHRRGAGPVGGLDVDEADRALLDLAPGALKRGTADAIEKRPSRRTRAKIEATTEDDIRRQMKDRASGRLDV